MTTIARGSKAGGGTNLNVGQDADPDEVNTDLNTVYTLVNGQLDDGNIETATIPGAKSHRYTAISDPSTPSSGDLLVYGKTLGSVVALYTKDSAGTVAALGGGTGRILLPLNGADLPDASGSDNSPPTPVKYVSTGTQTANSPKVTQTLWDFADATRTALLWTFILPGDYGSGGTLRYKWRGTTATTNSVVWHGGTASVVDASTDDRALVSDTIVTSTSTAPGTIGQAATGTLALTMTGAAANQKITVWFGRDGSNGSDDYADTARLLALSFEYVRA